MSGYRSAAGLTLGLLASAIVCSGSGASGVAVPTQSHVLRCLRQAGWTAHATTADGAKLIVATSGQITWTISLAPPKPQAGWTGYRKSPTPKDKGTLARCLK